VGDSAPGYALSYGVLANIQDASSLRDGQSVQVGAWSVCAALSHTGDTRPLGAGLKPLRSDPRAAQRYVGACRRTEWGFGQDYANKQARAAKVAEELNTKVLVLPETERQARPLAKREGRPVDQTERPL